MLPLRIGARGTQIVLRTAEGVVGRAAMSALQVAELVKHRGSSPAQADDSTPASDQSSEQESGAASAQQGSAASAQQTSPAVDPRRSDDEADAPPLPPTRPVPTVSAPQPQEVEPPTAAEPVHVSAEPELVREEAEPGAQDGAGASVTIRPPWEGYEHMSAREVIARLGDASAAELAAVQLYESSNRSRQTVLEAVERRLKSANGRG